MKTKVTWKMRRPLWRSLCEVGVRRELEYEWDDAVAVRWSFMFGVVAFDRRGPVRSSPDSGSTEEKNDD